MFCGKCGSKVSDDAKYCSSCGEKIKINVEKEKIKDVTKKPKPDKSNIVKASNEAQHKSGEEKQYKGLEGWLILLGLNLVVGFVANVYYFFEIFFILDIYKNYPILLIFDFVSTLSIALFGAYILYLYFKKNRRFKKYCIIYFSFALFLNVVSLILISDYINELDDYFSAVFKSFLGLLIWGLYLVKSKRVKQTFVE
ncbi:MAG: DUF2569 family protein [Candidatus Moranbacteria bacterium]|nr:DUF2569 family protein [Candidatus Moranbacteria bacterium]